MFKPARICNKLQSLFEEYYHESHHSSGDYESTSNQMEQVVEANDMGEDDLYTMDFTHWTLHCICWVTECISFDKQRQGGTR
ncbi:hypothetical protein Scep_001549 [Stephania cephalantha]|uniref:Uncharacterized protein n=1 Tax=Stephania cephalantha TaxID=152367 RepID=A0AAP0Q426_9MAGN